MSKRFYITTAIDYVNGSPHVGNAYEKVVADTIARSRRSLGQETFFLTGVDEHGQKVQQAAAAESKEPQVYCDELATIWQALAKKLELSNDDFIRTTQPRHEAIVKAIVSQLHASGHIYKATYEGYYSLKEETFLTEKDRGPDGKFDPAYGEVVRLKEDNYYFRLKDQQAWLIDYIERNPSFIHPESRRNETLGFLKTRELEDLCITRPTARLSWGIPLPFDPNYVNWVWFDALVNYISVPAALGDPALANLPFVQSAVRSHAPTRQAPHAPPAPPSLWPPDIHVIGKDIVKFHAIYWPIMLKAMGASLPKQILAHGFWQKDGEKISKTTGNTVDPIAVADEWGVDAFRFYVLRELDIGPDGNWTDAGFRSRYQDELAHDLGNLVNRSLSMLNRYRNGVVPTASNELAAEVEKITSATKAHLEQNELQAALQTIWSLVRRGNQYVDHTAPFKLAKDPAQGPRLDEVLYNLAELCRILAVLLWPFLPSTASKIYAQLGLNAAPDKFDATRWGGLEQGHTIGTPAALFPLKEE
ncbi:MAG: methionine--tRNA ligase [Verrucomicrobia bacterium]|nr:MAG: methionine--tRNA ligase [Verrucomicrobiota bacterium]